MINQDVDSMCFPETAQMKSLALHWKNSDCFGVFDGGSIQPYNTNLGIIISANE